MKCVGACNVLPLNTMVEAVPFSHTLCFWVSNLPLRGSEEHLNLWFSHCSSYVNERAGKMALVET